MVSKNGKKDILDEFGKTIVEKTFDDGLSFFKEVTSGTTKWGFGKEYTDVINKLSTDDQKVLKKYMISVFETSIFSFLSIFEERNDFKLIHEKDFKQTNLVEISEMLKAEIHGKNGWIARFSKVN